MKTGIFDIETSSLYANTGIILCAQIKTYGSKELKTVRADKFKNWKTRKSDNREVVMAVMEALDDYDILVAHNGQYFDKAWLNSACLKYGLPPRLRFEKFVDPCQQARRHLRLARNSLSALLEYFDIPENKTPIRFNHWLTASLDSDRKAMGYIVEHCQRDVLVLEKAYGRTRKLIKEINERGGA